MALGINRKYSHVLKRVIFLFPIVLLLCFCFLKLKHSEIYHLLIQEDNVLEYLQSACYFAAAIIALLISVSFFRSSNYLLVFLYFSLCLGFLFIFLEEISWGQRILGFQGPTGIIENNFQKEFSFHNLNSVQPYLNIIYILIGGFGAFAHMILPNRLRNNYQFILNYIIPGRFLFFYFLPTFVVYLYIFYISRVFVYWLGFQSFGVGNFIVWRDQEPAELLLSFGFLLFVLINRWRQTRDGHSGTESDLGTIRHHKAEPSDSGGIRVER